MHTIHRRTLLFAALFAAASAHGQSAFPNRPIRILFGFGAGGTGDTMARLYGQKMSEILGVPIVVDNRPGGNQMIAIRALQQAPADGYTLLGATKSSLVQTPALRADMGYDPLKDFTPIGMVVTYPGVVFVAPSLPIRSLKELVAYAQANPGKLNYGSGGTGSADHLATEALMSITGIKMVHVPYKSTADVIRETIAGHLHLSISPLTTVLQHVRSGQLRAIAVTSMQRVPGLPDVPALSEIDIKGLPDLDPHTYLALVGPAGMPPSVVARLNDAINKASAMPDMVARLRDEYGSMAATSTPEGFRDQVRNDIERWKVIGKTVKLSE